MTDTITDTVRDPRVEAWLDERHVTWTYEPELDLALVDVPASLANQARLEALDPDVVERYTADMAKGHQFPPIVAHRRTARARKLVLIGGNHRVAGANQAGRTTLPAYVVEAQPEMVVRLTYEDNRRHGLPPSDAERVAQAIHLIDTGTFTQEQAAEIVGIPAPKISQARSVVKADRRATDMGLGPTFTSLPKSARYQLGQLRSDPVFEQAARLVADSGMSVAETIDLVANLKGCSSDEIALNHLGLEQEERRERIQKRGGAHGKAKSGPSAKGRLSGALWAIHEVGPSQVAASCPTAQSRKELSERIDEAAKELFVIKKAL